MNPENTIETKIGKRKKGNDKTHMEFAYNEVLWVCQCLTNQLLNLPSTSSNNQLLTTEK